MDAPELHAVVDRRSVCVELERHRRREVLRGALRFGAGLLALVGFVALLGWTFRGELERFGTWFVDRFGFVGMGAGAFLADGVHFPLPPQFYLLTGIAGGCGHELGLASVVAGSVLGGLAAFGVARRLGRSGFVARRVRAPRVLVERLLARYGANRGLVVAALLPISYWVLCTLAGLMRLPLRAYGVLALMRVPRLVLSYALIVWVWRSTHP